MSIHVFLAASTNELLLILITLDERLYTIALPVNNIACLISLISLKIFTLMHNQCCPAENIAINFPQVFFFLDTF